MKTILVLLTVFWGCRSGNVLEENHGHIWGRDEPRQALWRAQVPAGWEQEETKGEISDTRQPNITYRCGNVTLWVHSFPHPIPPTAQVARWQRQLGRPGEVSRCAQGGYIGLRLVDDEMLAWAFELDRRHLRHLQGEEASVITLKAVGPPHELARLRPQIEQFALSFELSDEIPS